jgi:hypothetical protein
MRRSGEREMTRGGGDRRRRDDRRGRKIVF